MSEKGGKTGGCSGSTPVFALSVQFIKGVGPRKAKAFERLGIATVEDLLYHFPRYHLDRREITRLANLVEGNIQTVSGQVVMVETKRVRTGFDVCRVLLTDGTGRAWAVWFNQSYLSRQFRQGMLLTVSGKVQRRSGQQPEIIVEDFEQGVPGQQLLLSAGRLVPVYSSCRGLTQRVLRQAVHQALEMAGQLPENIPVQVITTVGLMARSEALHQIHFPQDMELYAKARHRLVFEEFFLHQTAHLLMREGNRRMAGVAHRSGRDAIARFQSSLPFPLTTAQKRVIGEIMADMESPHPMARMLQGDVGSGKTVVAAAALVKAVANGYQGAMMAPTEILAEQHFRNLQHLTSSHGVRIALLKGEMARSEKAKVLEDIAAGQVDVVVGTQALIQSSVVFRHLSLVITDEQHRFGVRQRAALQAKGEIPDSLVMTATPIPRSMAMIMYGDLDLSVIDEMPPGRKPVTTRLVPEERRQQVMLFVKQQLDLGRQAYVVCPVVEESQQMEAVMEVFDRLRSGLLAGYRIAFLHGRMPTVEKERVMGAYRAGEIQVLVSTTVVEVGVDVPNATVMVVEDAGRFGLAQLHQLRGRVGRGDRQSYCILLCTPKTEEARQRLEVLVKNTDGFIIAEHDLRLRGPGEFFGTRQHGLPEFRLARLPEDWPLLQLARLQGQRMLPLLLIPDKYGLHTFIEELERKFGQYLGKI